MVVHVYKLMLCVQSRLSLVLQKSKPPQIYSNGYHFNPLKETYIIYQNIYNRSLVSFNPTDGDTQKQGYPSKTMVILKF